MIRAAFLCAIMAPAQALACSCDDGGGFLQVIHGKHLIVEGVVDSHGEGDLPLSMEVAVDRVLRGDADDRVRVFGDTGDLCRPYITNFEVGQRYVWALDPAAEQAGAYTISSCGTYWLAADDERVSGRIDNKGTTTLSHEDLAAALTQPGTRSSGCDSQRSAPMGWFALCMLLVRRRR